MAKKQTYHNNSRITIIISSSNSRQTVAVSETTIDGNKGDAANCHSMLSSMNHEGDKQNNNKKTLFAIFAMISSFQRETFFLCVCVYACVCDAPNIRKRKKNKKKANFSQATNVVLSYEYKIATH